MAAPPVWKRCIECLRLHRMLRAKSPSLRLGLKLARPRSCGAGSCGHARRLGWRRACGRGSVPRARRASCSGAPTLLGRHQESGRSTRLGDRAQHARFARQLDETRLLAWLQCATPATGRRRTRTVVRVRGLPRFADPWISTARHRRSPPARPAVALEAREVAVDEDLRVLAAVVDARSKRDGLAVDGPGAAAYRSRHGRLSRAGR